jgi:hypothetical protein
MRPCLVSGAQPLQETLLRFYCAMTTWESVTTANIAGIQSFRVPTRAGHAASGLYCAQTAFASRHRLP